MSIIIYNNYKFLMGNHYKSLYKLAIGMHILTVYSDRYYVLRYKL